MEDSKYKVVEYPRVRTQMELLMESLGAGSEETLLKKVFGSKNMSQADLLLRELEENNGIKTYARIPYMYDFSY